MNHALSRVKMFIKPCLNWFFLGNVPSILESMRRRGLLLAGGIPEFNTTLIAPYASDDVSCAELSEKPPQSQNAPESAYSLRSYL